MSTQFCCPKNSCLGVQTNYEPKGKMITLNDLPVYTVGDSDRVVVVYYDIFGLYNTRVREISDLIA